MVELMHALGAATCSACASAPAGVGGAPLLRRLCPACRADLPTSPILLAAPPESVTTGWCLGPYAGPAGAAVRRAKYRGDVATIDALARWGACLVGPLDVDAVVPVPTPWARVMTRGVDVPARLAGPVALASGVPVLPVLRRLDGGTRASRSRRERQAPHFRSGRVQGRVLLVDDVVTTGATAARCAAELLGAGATEVWLYAVAGASPGVDNA